MELNLEGIAVGGASLLVIGAFHPLVIWCEYHFSQKIWPLFLLCGLICLGLALFAHGLLSILSQKSQANLTQERRGVPDYG